MNRGIIKILGKDATSFAACFYNEKKVAQGKAEQPVMINFGDLQKFNIHSPVVLSRYLQKIADQNPNVVHPQLHLMGTLPGNPSEEEKNSSSTSLLRYLTNWVMVISLFLYTLTTTRKIGMFTQFLFGLTSFPESG